MDGERPTLIDANGDVEGNLRGKDAQILGRFRGEIELSGKLVMGDGARVQARAVADAAEIGGEFRGDLKVRSLVVLERGRLEGSVEAQTLAVREGAQLNASVNTGGGANRGSGLLAPGAPSGVVAG